MWAQMAEVALNKIKEEGADKDFYQAKIDTARFYFNKILPHGYGMLASIVNGSKSVMAMQDEAF